MSCIRKTAERLQLQVEIVCNTSELIKEVISIQKALYDSTIILPGISSNALELAYEKEHELSVQAQMLRDKITFKLANEQARRKEKKTSAEGQEMEDAIVIYQRSLDKLDKSFNDSLLVNSNPNH